MESSTLYNLNIERAVLSAIVFSPEEFEILSSKLETQDFYLPFHQYVWRTMEELNREDKPIDEDFIKRNLEKKKEFDEVAMLNMLSANPIANPDAYIDELREMRKKRELEKLSLEVRREIQEGEKDSEDIISDISKSIDSIDSITGDEFISIKDSIDEFIEEMNSNEEKKVVPTGLNTLDGLIGGIEEGEVVVIGARPSMGKTSAVTTMIANWIERDSNFGILFDSLEMENKSIIRRLVSTLSDTSITDLKNRLIQNREKYKNAINLIKQSSLIIHDKNEVTIDYLRNKAKKTLRRNPNIKIWAIDHIGEVRYKDPRTVRLEIGDLMSMVRAIARDFKIGVIILSQLNREVTNRKNNKPTLADLRESGEIEQKADKVILIHRESYYQRGEQMREPEITDTEMIVAKNRDGATGIAKLKFESRCARFLNFANNECELDYIDTTSLAQVPVL